MEYIKDGDLLLALIVNVKEFPKSMAFWGDDSCPLQFGSCAYDKGKTLQSHIHRIRDRIPSHKTVEFLYIIKGSIEATFYSLARILVCKKILRQGDCIMLYDGGHGFKILEDNTIFIEVKNGPYVSVDADKEKF